MPRKKKLTSAHKIDMIVYAISQPAMFGDGYHIGISTISETPEGAWRRHIGNNVAPLDVPIRIMAWFDLGYRVRKLKLQSLNGDANE